MRVNDSAERTRPSTATSVVFQGRTHLLKLRLDRARGSFPPWLHALRCISRLPPVNQSVRVEHRLDGTCVPLRTNDRSSRLFDSLRDDCGADASLSKREVLEHIGRRPAIGG
jgi:hypothetical protein